jgi:hypothetical protein
LQQSGDSIPALLRVLRAMSREEQDMVFAIQEWLEKKEAHHSPGSEATQEMSSIREKLIVPLGRAGAHPKGGMNGQKVFSEVLHWEAIEVLWKKKALSFLFGFVFGLCVTRERSLSLLSTC